MAPARGQLDEISKSIGSIEAYIHENRHGVNNLSMKIDALSLDVAKRVEEVKTAVASDIEKLKSSLSSDIEGLKRRLDALEAANARREGAVTMLNMIRSWGPWIVALVASVAAFFSLGGRIK
jgi:uncharacterized protein YoxC